MWSVRLILQQYSKTVSELDEDGLKSDRDKAVPLALSASLGITSALAFNILAGIIQIQSPGYQKVEAIQYSVPIWLGLILYGLISPFVEEVVFRD